MALEAITGRYRNSSLISNPVTAPKYSVMGVDIPRLTSALGLKDKEFKGQESSWQPSWTTRRSQ
ncbi:hypothetical protein [Actinokineospora sp.]|uniref:hypothetical protein n=1 Tax=Actinokineospora sp. TaxID=1872133 RepID=UPI003D6AB69E